MFVCVAERLIPDDFLSVMSVLKKCYCWCSVVIQMIPARNVCVTDVLCHVKWGKWVSNKKCMCNDIDPPKYWGHEWLGIWNTRPGSGLWILRVGSLKFQAGRLRNWTVTRNLFFSGAEPGTAGTVFQGAETRTGTASSLAANDFSLRPVGWEIQETLSKE